MAQWLLEAKGVWSSHCMAGWQYQSKPAEGQTEPPGTELTSLRTPSPSSPTRSHVFIGSGSSAFGTSPRAPLGVSLQESGRAAFLLVVLLSLLYIPLSGRVEQALRVCGERA